MLSLQVCGLAVAYLSAVPSQLWQDITSKAYDCPIKFIQSEDVSSKGIQKISDSKTETWRILPEYKTNLAEPKDGILLPIEPSSLIIRPKLRQELAKAKAIGAYFILNAPDYHSISALATVYSGMGFTPDAILIDELPDNIKTLKNGVYLVKEVDKLPLLPKIATFDKITIIPYLDNSNYGQVASVKAEKTNLQINPSIEWEYNNHKYASNTTSSPLNKIISIVIVPFWVLGTLLNIELSSVIFIISQIAAWVVCLLLLVTLAVVTASFFIAPEKPMYLENKKSDTSI